MPGNEKQLSNMPKVDGDFYVVISKFVATKSDFYLLQELDKAVFVKDYQEALFTAQIKASNSSYISRIYRAHPVAKVIPQAPSVEEYKK